ncbi:flagellar biosynthesis anti-sigma factor FlgM [Anaeromicrobium sediminis]|uniref:Negative regulator of flagellin synthesis n=1 Tax=Anaeromicrobium sediminis TaxID=1478221 RepID=A0A267MIG2_9FIRM|nr:flagellar biosynthesis anti-sigma factor FlgM [Anaeromicrobium sediminis]PAB59371.1 flagellar biosynthesis anti-sigma factor FlgM [Anaeromicrobium sediminis]
MKINNIRNINKIMKAYDKPIKTESKKFKQEEDKIDISEKARDYQVAYGAYKKLPQIREEKVEEIKKKIETGTFNVSMEQVADKILKK